MQNRIFAHVLPATAYAARVHDFRTYHAISSDMIHRWVYPMVPEHLPAGYEKSFLYDYSRNFVYRERKGNTSLSRSAIVNSGCIIGADVAVGDGCTLTSTVLGNNVTVGANSTLKDAHLWQNVSVHANVSITHAIVCDGASVMEGAIISRGCVVGPNCVVGAGVVLPPFTRITCSDRTDNGEEGDDWGDESESEEEEVLHATDHDVVGSDGVGRLWKATVGDDEDDEDDEDD